MRYHHKSINIYLCYSICSFSSLSFFFRSLNVMQSKPLLLSTMITMTSSKCTDYLKRMMAIRDIIQWHGCCTSLNITVWCNGAIIVNTFISRTEIHKCTFIISYLIIHLNIIQIMKWLILLQVPNYSFDYRKSIWIICLYHRKLFSISNNNSLVIIINLTVSNHSISWNAH